MLTASDILTLPYDPQFSRAGVQYACESLHFTYNRMGLDIPRRMTKIVAGIAFEMGMRRWLEAEGIPYNRLGATPFTQPDLFDLALGGRRCDLKSYLIYNDKNIAALHADAGWALEAEALVPDDQFASDRMNEHDLYVFGFATAPRPADAAEARGPGYFVHTPPAAQWANILQWQSLGPLALKSNADRPLTVEIGGQDSTRAAVRERLPLPPRTRVPAQRDYFTVLYLAVPNPPQAQLGLHSPALGKPHIVEPKHWSNVWLNGQRLYLCGWINKHDFRRDCRLLVAGTPVRQYPRLATDNRALPMNHLRPMRELAELARQHAAGQRGV